MTEQAIRQGDEGVAPGLHKDQLDSGALGALNNIGEEQSSTRRVTAESFRLLTAKLKKKPIPDIFVQAAPAPAPVILPPV